MDDLDSTTCNWISELEEFANKVQQFLSGTSLSLSEMYLVELDNTLNILLVIRLPL